MKDILDNLEFDIPKDLGEIECLREHRPILALLAIRSRYKSLSPFINCYHSGYPSGGFDWCDSAEGSRFWDNILSGRNLNEFYERFYS